MKRRIQGLASSTSKATKKRSWREDDEDETKAEASRASAPAADSEDEELWKALEEGEGSGTERLDKDEDAVPTGPNPLIWAEISVAGKPRGKVFFELFRDVVPKTAENFRKLCLGVPDSSGGKVFGYKGTELHRVLPGRLAEGGDFERAASGQDLIDESFQLKHAKAGLLTMANRGPNTSTSRFQVTLRPSPELDGKQVVFGQVVADPSGATAAGLHVLYWVEAMGTSSGDPREAVVIEDCGEGGASSPQGLETQEARYARAGVVHGKLEDAMRQENLGEVLELTDDILDNLEWLAKKAGRATDGEERTRRSAEVEVGVKALSGILGMAAHKAGEVQGFDNKHGRAAKSQQIRVQELEAVVTKMF